jgi:hypothetical protein
MSEEQYNEEETEVEAHRRAMNEEPRDEETEVEAHRRAMNDEPSEDGADDEVEAHIRKANLRLDLPRSS